MLLHLSWVNAASLAVQALWCTFFSAGRLMLEPLGKLVWLLLA